MQSQQPSLSIVIPAFNEVATLHPLTQKLRQTLHSLTYEVILVDDGSTDGTTEVVKDLRQDNVTAVFHPKNGGKGAALRIPFQHVNGDIIVIQDGDLEYDPQDIRSLVRPIHDGYADFVLGSRFHGRIQRIHL